LGDRVKGRKEQSWERKGTGGKGKEMQGSKRKKQWEGKKQNRGDREKR